MKLSYTSIHQQFDDSGVVRKFGNAGRFQKLEINPYFEYGLTPKTTLVINAFLPAMKYSNQYGAQRSFGTGDIETSIRHRLNSPESRTVLSGQFSVQLPTYSVNRDPAPGNRQVDAEGKLMAGRGFGLGGRNAFISLGSGFRYRASAPADQIRTDASFGMDLTRRFLAIGQVFGITGLRNGKPLDALNNPSMRSDFDLYKSQLSLVARVTKRTRLQCGWINAFAGRNTGNGHTLLVAVWTDF